MAQKTWKIGEYCKGGILQVTVGNEIVVTAKDWNTKEIVSRRTFGNGFSVDLFGIEMWLNELTSSYYASKVIDWIKSLKS